MEKQTPKAATNKELIEEFRNRRHREDDENHKIRGMGPVLSRGFKMRPVQTPALIREQESPKWRNKAVTPLSPSRILKPRGEGFRTIESREGRLIRSQKKSEMMRERRWGPRRWGEVAKVTQADPGLNSAEWRKASFQPMKVTPSRGTVLEKESRGTGKEHFTCGHRSTSEQPSSCSKRHSERTLYRSVTPFVKKGIEGKPSEKRIAFLKQKEEKRARIKKEEKVIWLRLDFPTADCPSYPEYGMSDDAVAAAKRGRQCATKSFVCGRNQTRKALRDHERSVRLKGEVTLEADRLREYPEERRRYVTLMTELHNRADGDQGRRTCR